MVTTGSTEMARCAAAPLPTNSTDPGVRTVRPTVAPRAVMASAGAPDTVMAPSRDPGAASPSRIAPSAARRGWLAHATIGRALVTVNTSSPPLLLCSARSPWSRRPATSAEGAGSGLSTVGFAMDGAAEPTTTIVVMASSAKSSPAVAVVPCRTASIAAGVRIDSAAPAGRIDHAEATVEVVVA